MYSARASDALGMRVPANGGAHGSNPRVCALLPSVSDALAIYFMGAWTYSHTLNIDYRYNPQVTSLSR